MASSRDKLGCTPPPTSQFPSALEISRALGNVSVHCQEEGCIGKYIPLQITQEQSGGPWGAKSHLGKALRSEEDVFHNASPTEAVYGHSLIEKSRKYCP